MSVSRPWLLMLSAMYENGGNTVHRLLDGHPELCVYPFESQLGTHLVTDLLSSMYPRKYRWPVFALGASARDHYHAIIDEEAKVRIRTPDVSKFRDLDFSCTEQDRADLFERCLQVPVITSGDIVMAYMEATFGAWRNVRKPANPKAYVGYSPIIAVDADRILGDLPAARVIHVVRNPWSAYADTKRRAVPLPLMDYMLGWTTVQLRALAFRDRHHDRMDIVRFEDVLADPVGTLGRLCMTMGLSSSATLGGLSWNGQPIGSAPPWGVVDALSPETNQSRAATLSPVEVQRITSYAGALLDVLEYRSLQPGR